MGRHATPPPSADFGKLTSEILADKIRGQLTAATDKLAVLEESRGDLAMAAVDDSSQLDAYQAHVASIDATTADLRRLRDALEAAERRVEQDFAKARAAHNRKQIDAVLKAFADRDRAGVEVEAAVAVLAKAFHKLLSAASKARDMSTGMLPASPGFLAYEAELEDAVANELWRASAADIGKIITGNPGSKSPPASLPGSKRIMRTGSPHPYSPSDAPSLSAQLKDTTEFARGVLEGERQYDRAANEPALSDPTTWIYPGRSQDELDALAKRARGTHKPPPREEGHEAKAAPIEPEKAKTAAVPQQSSPQPMPGETEIEFAKRLMAMPVESLSPAERAERDGPPTGPRVSAAAATAIATGGSRGPNRIEVDGRKKREDW